MSDLQDPAFTPTDPAPPLEPATPPGPPVQRGERHQLTLPSGRRAEFLKVVTGDHVIRASRLLKPADAANMYALGFAIASVVGWVDGERFKYEDAGNFSIDDFMTLYSVGITGKGSSSPTST